jgi:transposase InsO family protein
VPKKKDHVRERGGREREEEKKKRERERKKELGRREKREREKGTQEEKEREKRKKKKKKRVRERARKTKTMIQSLDTRLRVRQTSLKIPRWNHKISDYLDSDPARNDCCSPCTYMHTISTEYVGICMSPIY